MGIHNRDRPQISFEIAPHILVAEPEMRVDLCHQRPRTRPLHDKLVFMPDLDGISIGNDSSSIKQQRTRAEFVNLLQAMRHKQYCSAGFAEISKTPYAFFLEQDVGDR